MRGVAFLFLIFSLVAFDKSHAQIEQRFQAIDRNGDGRISPQELNRPRLFRRLDSNGDGYISKSEAREFAGQRPAARGKPNRDRATTQRQNQSQASSVSPTKTVRYGRNAAQALDIYTKNGLRSAPVAIYVHGGAHMKGDKANVSLKPAAFLSQGYVFVSVNYRLLPEGRHPANAQDVAAAVMWVRKNIKQYGGDGRRIALIAHSAGAHLSALVATDERHMREAGGKLSMINSVVLLDSAQLDLEKAISSGELNERGMRIQREVFGTDPNGIRDASPANHIAPRKGIAPMFIAAGQRSITREISNSFANELRAANVPVKRVDDRSKSHSAMNKTFGAKGDKITQAAFSFLKKHL